MLCTYASFTSIIRRWLKLQASWSICILLSQLLTVTLSCRHRARALWNERDSTQNIQIIDLMLQSSLFFLCRAKHRQIARWLKPFSCMRGNTIFESSLAFSLDYFSARHICKWYEIDQRASYSCLRSSNGHGYSSLRSLRDIEPFELQGTHSRPFGPQALLSDPA